MKIFPKLNYSKTFFKYMVILFLVCFCSSYLYAETNSGEKTYKKLSNIVLNNCDKSLIKKINIKSRELNWKESKILEFDGNLRLLKTSINSDNYDENRLYLIRDITGRIFILSIPKNIKELDQNSKSNYSNLNSLLQNRAVFRINHIQAAVENESYNFAMLAVKPRQSSFDRIFKISIVLMLFFVMIGMGLTLTLKDFALVLKKPKGVILGTILQFGLMPIVSLGLAHFLGIINSYPFIFVGMILVTSTPGGATSNLMTYFAKGDLALSISLTSFSTVLSILFTPLILALYCTNVPNVNMPVKMIMLSIFLLVLVPLLIGMFINFKWEKIAQKAVPFFSILGIIAVIFIIVAGVVSNLHVFADTVRYGFKLYFMVFCLTFLGMVFGAIPAKLFGLSNYQTRAVSMEIGIRNVSLSMVIALLIQDYMGDFHSSMFLTSGVFGLFMYIAGLITIQLYKSFLPVDESEVNEDDKIIIDVQDESY